MIETRPLNRVEINLLIAEAPDSEVRNLINYLKLIKQDAYTFLNQDAVYSFGLIADGRPIYFAYICRVGHRFELWTSATSEIKHQFSLYKYSKRSLMRALESFSPIYATMETHNQKNLDWVKHLGFTEIANDGRTVTFRIEKRS